MWWPWAGTVAGTWSLPWRSEDLVSSAAPDTRGAAAGALGPVALLSAVGRRGHSSAATLSRPPGGSSAQISRVAGAEGAEMDLPAEQKHKDVFSYPELVATCGGFPRPEPCGCGAGIRHPIAGAGGRGVSVALPVSRRWESGFCSRLRWRLARWILWPRRGAAVEFGKCGKRTDTDRGVAAAPQNPVWVSLTGGRGQRRREAVTALNHSLKFRARFPQRCSAWGACLHGGVHRPACQACCPPCHLSGNAPAPTASLTAACRRVTRDSAPGGRGWPAPWTLGLRPGPHPPLTLSLSPSLQAERTAAACFSRPPPCHHGKVRIPVPPLPGPAITRLLHWHFLRGPSHPRPPTDPPRLPSPVTSVTQTRSAGRRCRRSLTGARYLVMVVACWDIRPPHVYAS